MSNNKDIIIYQSGEIEPKISVNKDKELDEKSNVQKMYIANSDKPVKLYSFLPSERKMYP